MNECKDLDANNMEADVKNRSLELMETKNEKHHDLGCIVMDESGNISIYIAPETKKEVAVELCFNRKSVRKDMDKRITEMLSQVFLSRIIKS